MKAYGLQHGDCHQVPLYQYKPGGYYKSSAAERKRIWRRLRKGERQQAKSEIRDEST